MEIIYIKSLSALVIVVILLFLCLKLAQRFTKFGVNYNLVGAESAIKINSTAYIDASSKIVNFECNNKNYIILIGKQTNLLIDQYEKNAN